MRDTLQVQAHSPWYSIVCFMLEVGFIGVLKHVDLVCFQSTVSCLADTVTVCIGRQHNRGSQRSAVLIVQ